NSKKILSAVNLITIRTGVKTIQAREIQSGVRLALPGELARHGVLEGSKAVTKFTDATLDRKEERENSKEKSKAVQRSKSAGIIFGISRVERLMLIQAYSERKGSKAAVYLAAVLEYLAAEVLELAGN